VGISKLLKLNPRGQWFSRSKACRSLRLGYSMANGIMEKCITEKGL